MKFQRFFLGSLTSVACLPLAARAQASGGLATAFRSGREAEARVSATVGQPGGKAVRTADFMAPSPPAS